MIELSNIIMFIGFTLLLTSLDVVVYQRIKVSSVIISALFSSIITLVWNIL